MKTSIHNLNLQARIGVFPWEKVITQKLQICVDLIDSNQDIHNINDVVDYDKLIDLIKRIAENKSFELLESMTLFVMNQIVEKFDTIRYCKIKIKKRISMTNHLYATIEKEYIKND